MTNEEKARELARDNCRYYQSSYTGFISADSFEECKASALKMAEWKDAQPICELEGWHTAEDKPKRDCIILVEYMDGVYGVSFGYPNVEEYLYSKQDIKRWKVIKYI